MTDVRPGQSLTAKAVAFDGPGGVEVIRVVDREVPPPAEGQVRIAVRAAAINPTDILLRQMGSADQPPPAVPGVDAAGIVESAGSGVSRLSAGQKVVAVVKAHRPAGGAQSQYIVVPAASVTPMPDGFSFAQACTFSMNGLTALRSLELADLREGQSLAISGGAGLLAQYASVIAKERGLRIIADAKPEEAEMSAAMGQTWWSTGDRASPRPSGVRSRTVSMPCWIRQCWRMRRFPPFAMAASIFPSGAGGRGRRSAASSSSRCSSTTCSSAPNGSRSFGVSPKRAISSRASPVNTRPSRPVPPTPFKRPAGCVVAWSSCSECDRYSSMGRTP